MAKFLTGNALNSELENIFKEAEQELILISPFIKLHSRFKDVLNLKKENDKLQITIVFGKNEDNLSKSVSLEEIEYFKQFPKIEIRYESRLHAKYYANEKTALLSSMNLYQYSQDNNIETGVATNTSYLRSLTSQITGEGIDMEAYNYFDGVIKNSTLLFQRLPEYNEGILGLGLAKKYKGSKITLDKLNEAFNLTSSTANEPKFSYQYSKNQTGYCIRTGQVIPFDIRRPMSYDAYQTWAQFENYNFPEKYCHKTGKPSNGKTSMKNPIL